MTTLVLVFKKIESKDKTNYENFYASSNVEIIINESDIENVFKPIYTTDIANVHKYLGKGSGWIIDSLRDHAISILKYNLLAGSSYMKLPKEVDHSEKGLINIQNANDNECFKWCLVRYLNPADHNPIRITKADKDFAKSLDFKDIQFLLKTRDIRKIEKENCIGNSVFDYENKVKYPFYVSKNVVKINILIYY